MMDTSDYKYPIIEIFDSFQGEGYFIGCRATFIRFAGCNLSCPWCDTKSQLNYGAKEFLTAEEIVDRVNCSIVIFTGGEPTLQPLDSILDCLSGKFGENLISIIETNGTGEVSKRIHFIACSPKPQSGYAIHDSIKERDYEGSVDYKYVVDDNLKIEDIHLASFLSTVYLQPEAYNFKKSVERAASMVTELSSSSTDYDVRLGIQAHKVWEVR